MIQQKYKNDLNLALYTEDARNMATIHVFLAKRLSTEICLLNIAIYTEYTPQNWVFSAAPNSRLVLQQLLLNFLARFFFLKTVTLEMLFAIERKMDDEFAR